MSAPFVLSSIDKDSPLWRKLMQHYTTRRDELRGQNDANKSPEDTANLRGRIEEVKTFLRLAEQKTARPED